MRTLAAASIGLVFAGFADGAAALRSPVDVARQQSLFHAKPRAFTCADVRAVPSRLQSVLIYADQKGSIVDPEHERQNRALLADTVAEEDTLARSVTQLVGAEPAYQAPMAQCILTHLRAFAQGDAFVASDDIRGTGAVRLMAVTPILAYLVLRDSTSIPAEDDQLIRAWIGRVVEHLQTWQGAWPYRNNIEDWTQAALALAGVALDRDDLLNRAVDAAAAETATVTEAGTLPLEDARGKQALTYNLFAAQALGIIAATARANGRGRPDEGWMRLMRTMAKAVARPESFPIALPRPKALDRANMGWLLLYLESARDPVAVKEVCARRPLYSWRAGGDWFVLFGNPRLCS